MEYLFSYGTLQKPNVQLDLFGRLLKSTPDKLIGYRLTGFEITDEIFLAKGESPHQKTLVHTNSANDFVIGTAFELSNEELLTADKYEPVNYKRIMVVLQSGRQAWIYIAMAGG